MLKAITKNMASVLRKGVILIECETQEEATTIYMDKYFGMNVYWVCPDEVMIDAMWNEEVSSEC